MQVGRDRLAQGRDTGRGGIAVLPVAQSLHGGLDDVLGRRKVRLSDPEVDDIRVARRQRLGARQHGKGILFSDPVEPGNCLHDRSFRHGSETASGALRQ